MGHPCQDRCARRVPADFPQSSAWPGFAHLAFRSAPRGTFMQLGDHGSSAALRPADPAGGSSGPCALSGRARRTAPLNPRAPHHEAQDAQAIPSRVRRSSCWRAMRLRLQRAPLRALRGLRELERQRPAQVRHGVEVAARRADLGCDAGSRRRSRIRRTATRALREAGRELTAGVSRARQAQAGVERRASRVATRERGDVPVALVSVVGPQGPHDGKPRPR